MVTCEICGKLCKNTQGLAIHKGHMHTLKRDTDLETEVKELKVMVADLTDLVRTMQAKGGNGDNWKKLSELTAPPVSPIMTQTKVNYADVVNELKTVLVLIH